MRSAPIAYLLNTGHGWGGIRRAQDKICRTIKNTSLTVITDCGNKKNIHPTDKKTVGERLADNTLKDIYGISGYNGNGARQGIMKLYAGMASRESCFILMERKKDFMENGRTVKVRHIRMNL